MMLSFTNGFKRPAEPSNTSESAAKKTKVKSARGLIRPTEKWCRNCVSRLASNRHHRCSSQTGIGIKSCVDCKDIKAVCKPLPQVAVQSLIAALAAADAVDDKDEQSVHVFPTAIMNVRRRLKADAVTTKEASTTLTATTAPVAETVPLAERIPSAMSSPDYASEFLDLGRRIADALEAIHRVKKARWDSEQQEEEDAEYIPSDSE